MLLCSTKALASGTDCISLFWRNSDYRNFCTSSLCCTRSDHTYRLSCPLCYGVLLIRTNCILTSSRNWCFRILSLRKSSLLFLWQVVFWLLGLMDFYCCLLIYFFRFFPLIYDSFSYDALLNLYAFSFSLSLFYGFFPENPVCSDHDLFDVKNSGNDLNIMTKYYYPFHKVETDSLG